MKGIVMEKDLSVIKTIDTKINNDDYLLSILDEHHSFNDPYLREMLALTLNYYILTRDNNPNLTLDEIKTGFDARNHGIMTPQELENVIELGYLTHLTRYSLFSSIVSFFFISLLYFLVRFALNEVTCDTYLGSWASSGYLDSACCSR